MKRINQSFWTVLVATVFLTSCSTFSFKAQDAVLTPGLRYTLTIETLDSARVETEISDAESIPGIKVDVKWVKDGKDLVAKAVVINDNPNYVVKAFEGPYVDGLDFDIERFPAIVPCGMGVQLRKAPDQMGERARMTMETRWKEDESSGDWFFSSLYPSPRMSMAWMAFCSQERGLYIGSHDKGKRGKEFRISFHPEDRTYSVSIKHLMTCFAGQRLEVPETRIHNYKGTWHAAADYYRSWFDSCTKLAQVPQWLKESSGWMLAISKQQNDEVMYSYDEYDNVLADATIDRGLDIVGLFGWAHGGHDRFYPDYLPDPKRGGESALRAGLRGLRARGLRSIMYVNGQLIDQNGTEYWADTGRFVTMVSKEGTLISEKWHKYSDAPARTHGRACFNCKVWQDRMLSLAMRAHDLGADGIIYDQLAVHGPTYCYSPDHGHSVPAVVVEKERLEYVERISEAMKKVNPEFVVMTEGIADYEMDAIHVFHGCSFGTYPPSQAAMEERFNGKAGIIWFPEMLEYTFPELNMTLRNPAPVTSRNMSNYALVAHLKNELECRYRADVRYLREDRVPVPDDYWNVNSKPNLDLVTSQDPVAMRIYQKALADFQTANRQYLRLGRFVDTQGFSFEGSHELCEAKGFEAEGRLAVVVWNVSGKEALSYSVKAAGRNLVSVSAPDWDASSGAPVPPESIALLIFE